MKLLKVTFFASVLAVMPALASACAASKQAMSCAEGMVWDDSAHSCIKQTNT
ncbi:hypothetical protein [Litorivita sp. NS0012-18]|uniref:hypothetical protein n=1 Tax=Litorivita sp. NS0012-18 TaxID=3127655 RepID=UPI003108DCEF